MRQNLATRLKEHIPSGVDASGPSRTWLIGLLAFTLLFAALSLFAKFELDTFREGLRRTAETEAGKYFRSRSISLVGLRGLRVHDFRFAFASSRGETEINAPEALVLVDLLDLLYGKVTVERIQVDGASLRLTAAPSASEPAPPLATPKPVMMPSEFRVTGKDCTVELSGILLDKPVALEGVAFDAYRLSDSPDCHVALQARLRGAQNIAFSVNGRFAGPEDFEFEAGSPRVDTSAVNALLPNPQEYVVSGAIAPVLRIQARPGMPIEAQLRSTVVDLLTARQPENVPPISGNIDARLLYDRTARRLDIAEFGLDGPAFRGTARGSVDLSGTTPQVNIQAEATRIPLEPLLARLKAPEVEKYGNVELALADPYRITATLTGTPKEPIYAARLAAQSASVAYTPADKRWPAGSLELGAIDVAWDSAAKRPDGTLNITGGKIEHKESNVSAEQVSGTLRLKGDTIEAYPVLATVTGNACAAHLIYDWTKQNGTLELTGALSGIENTKLATAITNTRVAGTAAVRAKGVKKGNTYQVTADLDATMTRVGYSWYFDKAPGMGGVGTFTVDWLPKKSIELAGDIILASSPLKAKLSFKHDGEKYRLQTLTADTDSLDVPAVGRCLTLPYLINGGTGTDGHYIWNRRNVAKQTWDATASFKVDEIYVRAVGKDSPMHLRGADFTVNLDKGDVPTGKLLLKAHEGYMPSLREEWFVPVAPDPKLFPDYKPDFQTWEYTLAGDYVEVPPWKGTNFSGTAYSSITKSGLSQYAADIDGGRIQGSYERNRPENSYVTTVKWKDVPSHYFIEHLRLSNMLTGPTTGELTYSLDRDDPGTLNGKGYFEVNDGKFSEEFLYSKLQGKGTAGGVTLPSLRFSQLKSGIEFKRDIIKTPDVDLTAEGIHVQGAGQFVTGGDMDYDLKVTISPEKASQIPVLMEYFNVEGHRLSQQNIELAFKVTGPTGGPKGKLAETPPLSVTLVSGALEMTSEAIKVIDVPRKILVDLLKLGGGLVGATK